MKTFYITTPIYYVNDKPHIGHAYTTIAADILARWKRFSGEKVFFLTGTDEHGSKIAQAAVEHDCTPQEYADRLAREFQSLWRELDISNDDFVRTTEARHVQTVQSVFQQLMSEGEIFKGEYEGWYCVPCESFRLESELQERKCPDCGHPVEKEKQESYFFKMSKYTESLLSHYQSHPQFLSPDFRAQEIINFVKGGLRDLSVSRVKEKWGIPVPNDSSHTVYVWFDALLNYLTAAGYSPSPTPSPIGRGIKGEGFEELWPCDIHFVGKEIFRFHTAIWPTMLFALKLPLPKKVFAHGWWTVDGQKMSKSRGNIVDPKEIIAEFGADAFRYFLFREIPFGTDGDFSKKVLKTRYNSELANELGNLFSRTLTLLENHFGGAVKEKPSGIFNSRLKSAFEKISKAYDGIAFHEVLEELVSVVKEVNRYLDQKAPWNLVKRDSSQAARLLAEVTVILRWLTCGFAPFMPKVASQMWMQIGEPSTMAERDEGSNAGWKILQDPLWNFALPRTVWKERILFPRK